MKKNEDWYMRNFFKNKKRFFKVLTLCTLGMICSQVGLRAEAISAVPDTISLDLKEVKMERFVEVMKQKTGLNFLYNALLFWKRKG